MYSFSLLLVIASTVMHAYWNYILKRVNGGIVFVWFFTALTCLLYLPYIGFNLFTLFKIQTPLAWLICALSILAHLLYFVFLDRAYLYGDLSVIYPITRGLAPIFTIIFAITLFNERLHLFQLLSIGLIILGTMLVTGLKIKGITRMPSAINFAIICAMMISTYTLVDKYAIAVLMISPFLLDFLNNLGRMITLTPLAIKNHQRVKNILTHHFKEALIIAILSPLTYLLVLFSMKHLTISIISPMRQLSILFGSMMGMRLLLETQNPSKTAGIFLTFSGVVIIYIIG